MPGVNSSRALKFLALAFLLSLTLGWKLLARQGELVGAHNDAAAEVTNFLRRHNFIVIKSEPMTEGQLAIHAAAGDCRVRVAKSAPVGWDRDMVRRSATASERVFVVFDGRIYDELPSLLTVSNFLWTRFRRELGFSYQMKSIYTVVQSNRCRAETLPWAELN